MAKIAYVDHSFHRKTLSTDFLPGILRRHGHVVDYFWDDAWNSGPPVQWSKVKSYDVVIMFQVFCPIGGPYYRQLHPNVIFIPMLDQFGIWQGPLFNLAGYLEPLQGSKVINFSNAMHGLFTGLGINSHVVRFYQPVLKNVPKIKDGLHGFFWLRREEQIPWLTIKKLIAKECFDSFHIHLAPDPGSPEPILPSRDDIKKHKITISTWFEQKSDFNAVLERANVFFAARMEEGIGQSFLEAMARGQCVVSPNQGTMNEYIIHGLNGLLYDNKKPEPLDFSRVVELGQKAKEAVQIGHVLWEQSETELVEYILEPSINLYSGKYQHNFVTETQLTSFNTRIRLATQECWILRKTRFFWHPLKNLFLRFLKFE